MIVMILEAAGVVLAAVVLMLVANASARRNFGGGL
jgi:hypothetical protein